MSRCALHAGEPCHCDGAVRAGRALRADALDRLDPRVQVPAYDREALTPGVVHLGVGCFHRSHQAVYFDELAARGISTGWGIVGVGLHSPEMRDALAAQDGLYSVVERGPMRDRVRVVGAMTRYHFAPDDPGAVLDALADPRTRLVTLTVTASGYRLDDPEVVADLRRPRTPRSALGFLVEALDRRRRSGVAGFTVLSCDNLPDNGVVTREAVLGYAARRDHSLATWIDAHAAFPSSMVDRITPRTTDADRERLAREFGLHDRWPVITEPFSQWMVEDAFCNGRPPLERVGVQWVDDVRPYALMKTRLLNAAHVALAHLGALAGLERMDDVMRDPVLSAYADALMREIEPLLEPVPGIDVGEYRRRLLARFANPRIADRLDRVGRCGSAKVPAHLLTSLKAATALDHPCELMLHAVAGWIRLLRGVDDRGRPITVADPLLETLRPLARAGRADPRPLLSASGVFGDLADDARFVAALTRTLRAQDRAGVLGALERALPIVLPPPSATKEIPSCPVPASSSSAPA
jgi:mannitol 2-dehydrogenase